MVDGFGRRGLLAVPFGNFANELFERSPDPGVEGACGLEEKGTVQPDIMSEELPMLEVPKVRLQQRLHRIISHQAIARICVNTQLPVTRIENSSSL